MAGLRPEVRDSFRGKRVGFLMHPEMGHLLPTLKLAKWLRDGGTTVSYLGPSDFQELIEREQLEYLPLLERAAPRGYYEAWSRARWSEQRGAARPAPPDLRTLLIGLFATSEGEALLRGRRFDLLCVDALLWPVVPVAQRLGLPTLVVQTDGIRRFGRPGQAHELALAPRCLSHAPPGSPPRSYLGLSLDLTRRQPEFDWAALGSKPIVFCSLGTNTHFQNAPERVVAATIQALAIRDDLQLILHGGTHLQAAQLPPLPRDAIIASSVPQLQILERAALFITHGGLGGVKEAIHCGVPMLMFPMFGDQFFNAETVCRLGIGARAARTAPARAIATLIDQVLHGPYRDAIVALREEITEADEFEEGVTALLNAIKNEVPSVTQMPGPIDERVTQEIAAAWARDALAEHASIASFARFTLELLAVGAPADLLLDAQYASRDEVEHARTCFTIASRLGGRSVAPGPLDISGADAARDLMAIVIATVKEGCIGETLSAVLADARSEVAADPEIKSALSKIAADEARHAELAWRFIGWAIQQGGAAIRRAVVDTLDAALQHPPAMFDSKLRTIPADVLRRHGLLDEETARAVIDRAVSEMIAPLAEQLRGGDR